MNASDNLNDFRKHRLCQRDFVRWLIGKNEHLGQIVRGCVSFVHMREWTNHDVSKIVNANFCKKHLLCPTCARRRAMKLIARYTPKAECLAKDNPGMVPAMITFGPRNGPDVLQQLLLLKDIFKKMIAAARKASSNPAKNLPIEWNKVLGFLRSIEVTNKGNGWHVHAHVFVLLSAYVDREALSEELVRFSGGECSIVDVRACKNGIIAGMCEVIKYSLKPGELTNEQTLHVYEQFKGARLIGSGGLLRGPMEGDIDQDDLPDLDGPTRDLIAYWLFGQNRYHIQELPPEAVLSRQEEARLSCQIMMNQGK